MTANASVRSGAFRATLMFGAAGLALAMPAIASAQDEGEAAQGASASGNEIVVTATKRELTLQDTPVAVSVTSGETIERAQIRDLKDLQTIVPSLRVTQLQSSANTNFIIRGFGNGANNAGIEPSVGVFVDGVYRSRTAAQISDLPNVSRIEVLRGPQSTLFGKNASAGVISIVTEEPQFDLGGSAELGYGNYNAIVARGYVTGPLSESAAVSVAGGYSSRDGYVEDLGTGDRTNERNRYFVRGQLLIEPSATFKARIIADYDSIDENCCAVSNLKPSLPPQLGGPPGGGATLVVDALGDLSDFRTPFAGIAYSNRNSTNDISNWGISGQMDFDLGGAQLTSITAFRNSRAITAQDPDFSSADLINPIGADVDLDTFTQELRVTASLGDRVNLLLGGFYIKENVDQTGELKWGTQARLYANQLVQALSGGALALYGTPPGPPVPLEYFFGALEGNPGKYTGKFFQAGTGNDETFTLDSEAYSIFGQLDFEVTDRLTLTAGGNYTNDKKDYTASIVGGDTFSQIDFNAAAYAPLRYNLLYQGALLQGLDAVTANNFAMANMNVPAANPLNPLKALQYLPQFLNVPNSVEDGKVADDNFSYTLRLAFDATDNVNLYASYATGFKASSINLSRDSRPFASDRTALETAGLARVNQTYGTRLAGPEESTVYEFGAKGSWSGFSANLAVFKQIIEGFQSNIFTGSGFALSNAGKQSTFGVEFEGQAQLFPGFSANLGVTYLNPKYDDFKFSAVGDLSGTRPAGIPEWTVVIGGQYEHEFADGNRLILGASYHHESEVKIVEGLPGYLGLGQAAAIAAADPFTREVNDVSAQITYAMDNGVELSVWGRNLLDDRYILSVFDTPAQPFSISGYPNQPLTWGGAVRFKW